VVREVSALQVLDAPFAGARPGYAAHDPRMPQVYCELGPTVEEMPVEGPFVVQDSPPPKPASASPASAQPPEATTRPAEAGRARDIDADSSPSAD
jgi:hypothetical protein